MKAEKRRLRKFGRIAGRAVRLLVAAGLIALAAYWLRPHYPALVGYLNSFGRARVDTKLVDEYYDLLSKHGAAKDEMVLGLGVKDEDDIQVAIDRLKGVMGLGRYKIWLAHHDADKPPAYIKQLGYGDMGILISRLITARREVLNLLVHELGHIYVWGLKSPAFGKCDQEKLNDCAGVFLGLGVVMLNGLTYEFTLMPGEGYEARTREFGYLRPEQIGYLVARFCAERGASPEALRRFLNASARRYFDIGLEQLRKSGRAFAAPERRATGLFWCPGCGSLNRIGLSGGGGGDPACVSCGRRLSPQANGA